MGASASTEVTFADVLRARFDRDRNASDEEADARFRDLLNRFKRSVDGPNLQVGTFSCGGVYTTGNGRFHYATNARGLLFEAGEAERLIYRIDQLAERAIDWWRPDPNVRWWGDRTADDTGGRRAQKRQRALATEREPHLNLAYNLMTATYAAMDDEGERHRDAAHRAREAWPRRLLRRAFGTSASRSDRAPSEACRRELAIIRDQVDEAERLFRGAAQRDAQGLYGKGMLIGIFVVGVVYGIISLVLDQSGESSTNVIAFGAGSVGAAVSVLQRMTVGKLTLDITAGKAMLVWLGAMRPCIGGVLGSVLFVFVEAGLLPIIPAGANLLAFYAALGFVAGFNERFAQDMLAHSASSLRAPTEQPSAATAAA